MKTFDVIRSFGMISNKRCICILLSVDESNCKFYNLVVRKRVAILQEKNSARKRVSPYYSDIIFNPETQIRKNRKIRRIGTYFNHETNPHVELKTDSGILVWIFIY